MILNLPEQYLMTDLLKHRVRCDQGIDHGIGINCWMHPPVHRILGWASKPSSLRLARDIWRLDQCRGISEKQIYVKGNPANYDQSLLSRLPTLIDAELLSKNGSRIGLIADFVFSFKDGKIIHYLVSRTDPRLPGTSRWILSIDRIIDQQPGMVVCSSDSIDDLPLSKSSIRQDILRKTRHFRDQFQHFSDIASNKLEGWLEDPPWEESIDNSIDDQKKISIDDPLEDWDTSYDSSTSEISDVRNYPRNRFISSDNDEDPWF